MTWQHFAADQWEHHPGFLPAASGSLALGKAEAFALLCRASKAHELGNASVRVALYIGQAGQVSDHDRLMPRPSDGDLSGYYARMADESGGRPWMLLVNHIQTLDRGLFDRCCELLDGAYDGLGGVPTQYVTLDISLGHYPCTPFAVHVDSASNFMTMVDGERTMRFWDADDPDVVAGKQDYGASLPSSTPLVCREGDLLYWPSNAWHVGESPDAPSTALALGLFLGEGPEAEIASRVRRASASGEPPARRLLPYPAPGLGVEMPDAALHALSAARACLAGSQLEDDLLLDLLRRTSAYGFVKVPARLRDPVLPAADEPLEIKHKRAVQWGTLSNGDLAVAANGHVFRPPWREVQGALERLQAGECCTVADLAADAGGQQGARGQIEVLVAALAAAGALRTGAEARHPVGASA